MLWNSHPFPPVAGQTGRSSASLWSWPPSSWHPLNKCPWRWPSCHRCLPQLWSRECPLRILQPSGWLASWSHLALSLSPSRNWPCRLKIQTTGLYVSSLLVSKCEEYLNKKPLWMSGLLMTAWNFLLTPSQHSRYSSPCPWTRTPPACAPLRSSQRLSSGRWSRWG